MKSDRVLLVDDERNIRLTLTRALEDMGLEVETAASGEEALARLRERRYGLMLLDLKLPGIDGLEVLRRMRALDSRPDVVVFTAHGTIETAVDAMKYGATDFIRKPFSPAELRAVVERVQQRARQPATPPGGNTAVKDCYRVVVPVADVETARRLARLGAAAVHAHAQVELVLVHVIEVPMQTSPQIMQEREQEKVERLRNELEEASEGALAMGVEIRPIVLFAHSTAGVVRSLAEQEPVDQVLLRWRGPSGTGSALSASSVEEIVRQASCTVTLVKPSEMPVNRVLGLVSEGPDAAFAVRQAHLLVQGAGVATLTLLNVQEKKGDGRSGEEGLHLIRRVAGEAGLDAHEYETRIVEAEDVRDAIVEAAADYDTICAGATRSTALAEFLFGSVPRAVAEEAPGTVIVVRGPRYDKRTLGKIVRKRLLRGDP